MKIIAENLSDGKIVVIPQDSDDLYYIYNIIAEGDKIVTKTSRRIKRDESGKDNSERISVTIELRIEKVEFHGFGETIRVRGIILTASEDSITLGSYHSINLELFKKIIIIKENWIKSDVEILRNSQMGKSSPLVVVAIDDQSALVTQVGSHASKILLDFEPPIPRKGSDPVSHQKETQNFFRELAKFLRDQRKKGIAQYIIVGGPGYTKDAFYDYIKLDHTDLLDNLLIVTANSAGTSGIREIIYNKIPQNFAGKQEAKTQASLIQDVLEAIGLDTGLIAYGSDVIKAIEYAAVEKLLILDSELHDTIDKRKEVEQMIIKNSQNGGIHVLMSSMYDSGDILKGLGGIVAFLRFPMPK